jgi:hypothetical protein
VISGEQAGDGSISRLDRFRCRAICWFEGPNPVRLHAAWLALCLSIGCTQSALTFVGRAPERLSDDELCATATWAYEPQLTEYFNEMTRRGLIDDRDREAIAARELSRGISRCAAVAILVKPPVSEERPDDRTVKLLFGGRLDLNVVYRPRHEVILREGRVEEWN